MRWIFEGRRLPALLLAAALLTGCAEKPATTQTRTGASHESCTSLADFGESAMYARLNGVPWDKVVEGLQGLKSRGATAQTIELYIAIARAPYRHFRVEKDPAVRARIEERAWRDLYYICRTGEPPP